MNLGVLHGDRILYLIRVRNRDLVTAHLEVGSSLPATSTSIGKMILSSLSPAQLREALSEKSFTQGYGPNAAHSIEDLEEHLDAVRKDGTAIQDEEVASGLRSIAAPIYDADHEIVAGINVAVSANRYSVTELRSQFRPSLLLTAREISTRLGARVAELYLD